LIELAYCCRLTENDSLSQFLGYDFFGRIVKSLFFFYGITAEGMVVGEVDERGDTVGNEEENN
jgi:hypothetical protein